MTHAVDPTRTRYWRDVVRPAVLDRDRHTCQRCHRDCSQLKLLEVLIVDHIIPWREGGAWYDLANLQTLCSACSGRKDGPRAGSRARSRGMRALT